MSTINTAIILDGGKVPAHLDESKPKGLVQLGERTLLSRQVIKLKEAGIKNIIISSHQFAEEYDDFVKEKQELFTDINIYSTKERQPLGSGGAVKNTMLNTNTEIAIVLNGNSLVDIDYSNFIDFHFKNNFENSLIVTKHSNGDHPYYFGVENNAIKSLTIANASEDQLKNAGVYILSIDLFNLTHLQTFRLSKEILPQLCDGSFGAFEVENTLLTLETEQGYKDTLSKL